MCSFITYAIYDVKSVRNHNVIVMLLLQSCIMNSSFFDIIEVFLGHNDIHL